MGVLNNPLGMNLTNEDPLLVSPYNAGSFVSSIPTPPPDNFFLLLDGTDFILLDGENLNLL